MEFWGVEVKSGQPLQVSPGADKVLHLSQACLGEVKKGSESVCLFVTVDGKKLVLGTLTPEKLPQQLFDLVFDRDFELTHNCKNGSVYFYGYKAVIHSDEPSDSEFDNSDEDIPLLAETNGNLEIQAKEKPAAAAKVRSSKESAPGKEKGKLVEFDPIGNDSDDSDDLMSEDESESDEDGGDSSEEKDSDEEDDETLKKAASGQKRPAESASKTPGADKKAKLVTPQKTEKTDGKKGGVHVATPHPSKQAGKTPANKSNQKTPATGESHSCKACNRGFKSDVALQSHNQAKHSAGK